MVIFFSLWSFSIYRYTNNSQSWTNKKTCVIYSISLIHIAKIIKHYSWKLFCLKIIHFMYWCIWHAVLLVISTTALNSEEPREGVSMVKVVSLLAGSVDFKPETETPPTATQVNGDPKIRIFKCFNATVEVLFDVQKN